MKILKTIFFSFIGLLLTVSNVSATADTLLTNIGNVDVTTRFAQWSYTNPNPTLTGQVAANYQVTVTIDGQSNAVPSDANGFWSYTPTTLTEGTHQVSIASGTDTYNFTLTIGTAEIPIGTNQPASTNSGELLKTGSEQYTLIFLAAGIFLATIGAYQYVKIKS